LIPARDGTQVSPPVKFITTVDAALIGAALRLTVFLDRPFREVDVFVIDNLSAPISSGA